MLEDMLDKIADFKNYENNSSDDAVKFTLQFANGAVVDAYMQVESNGFTKFENDFKLQSSKPLGMTNMYAFNAQGCIQKYDTVGDIIKEFYDVRLSYYQKRKDYLLSKLQSDLELLRNKIRFVRAVVNEEIVVHKLKKADLEDRLRIDGYKSIEDSFDYITRIPVYNLTIDKVEDLERECKCMEDKFNSISETTTKQMWKNELDVLCGMLQNAQHTSTNGQKKAIKKKLNSKTT
jgi:DNA topoisomerase-2